MVRPASTPSHAWGILAIGVPEILTLIPLTKCLVITCMYCNLCNIVTDYCYTILKLIYYYLDYLLNYTCLVKYKFKYLLNLSEQVARIL
jgi:hypothetical protein